MKRSKPLRRGKAPRRRTPMRNRRGSTKYSRRERHTDYMLGVKQLPCAALIVPGHVCSGPIEADHAGERGYGQKAHDSTVIPMCQLGHRQRTDFSGPFRDWDQAKMRDFLAGRILQTQRTMRSRGFVIPLLTRDDVRNVTAEIARSVLDRDLKPENAPKADIARALGIDPEILFSADQMGRCLRCSMWPCGCPRQAEDLREDGDIDVRHPDAAPLPVARVVSEGDQHR